MESKGYICPLCKTVFNSLDVSRLVNARTGGFDCDVCPDSELQAYDSLNSGAFDSSNGKKASGGPHELHSRLMEQTRLIVELLKKADEISIPAFNPLLWLEQNASKYSLLLLDGNERDQENGPQLAIAGANSSTCQLTLSVDFAEDSEIKDANASVSTPLPEWHMYSTVTGEAIRHHHSDSTSPQLKQEESSLISGNSDQDDILNYYTQVAGTESDLDTTSSSKQPKLDSDLHINTNVSNPVVLVGGCEIPLDKITEDDKDKMTEEEYASYYEIYMAQLQ